MEKIAPVAEDTSFHAHCFKQISGRLAERARDQLKKKQYNEVLETCIQFIFNVCGAAIYANWSKEESYDKICFLKKAITYENETQIRAEQAYITMQVLSADFAEKLKDFKFDAEKIKK